MKAVILAAGEGIRLLPITATRPKHLIKVGGKPILEHCLSALKKAAANFSYNCHSYTATAFLFQVFLLSRNSR